MRNFFQEWRENQSKVQLLSERDMTENRRENIRSWMNSIFPSVYIYKKEVVYLRESLSL